MSVREIKVQLGMRRLGTVANTSMAKKPSELSLVQVFPKDDGVGIRFHMNTGVDKFVNLSPGAAMEVVKGILQNMSDISVAADEEMQCILKEKLARSAKEAQSVVQCVVERYNETTRK